MADDRHDPPVSALPADWLDFTTRMQGLASDPTRSAWVSANAGSGKTHVLTERVIRLLLSGCRASAILCLTYTKAAAAEMSNRIFQRLGEWVTLDDETLAARIESIERAPPDAMKIAEARRLFARALETPGGLKIQTIHAFCEALLHQFPLEANVAGHFSVLDDRASAVLLTDARRLLLTAAASRGDPELTDAFATVLELADDTGLEKLMGMIVAARSALQSFFDDADRHGGVEARLRQALEIAPQETSETVLSAFWPLEPLAGPRLSHYIDLGRSIGGKTVGKAADGLAAAAALSTPLERYHALCDVFLTSTGKPRADSAFVSAALRKAALELEALVLAARDRLVALNDRLSVLHMFDATRAALILANRLNRDYEEIKKSRSQLDFDDLIGRTASLLMRSDVSAWVHYKLDRGIDHILVDEAQDTSPVQWSIIGSLADDFFAGESARRGRTMFAVGDEKQSIYSFQGARPEQFSQEADRLERLVQGSGSAFSRIRLQLSFRSTEDVLTAVDGVFRTPAHARGLSATGEPIAHASNRIGHAGLVEVWDTIAPLPGDEEEDWEAAFDATPETAPPNQLAERIAARLADWIGKETITERGTTRAMRPGDVIVLVRKRDAFVTALTRALKANHDIPVAGADRLVLTDHIAVKDLVALGRFLVLPQDDLSLAACLKSPLFSVSEETLASLAAPREPGTSLWSALEEMAAAENGPWRPLMERLGRLQSDAARLPVHDFYATLLGAGGGRAAFLARLGSEASDVLDEFLGFCLDHEENGLPGLQSFLASLELEAPTIKREQDKERNEIRVMTVHAAKGLEAPVVFLVDSGGKAFVSQHMPSLRMIEPEAGGERFPVWQAPGSTSNSILDRDKARLKDLAEQEYRRLLYVGMTRAADRLIVCGYRGKTLNPESWHAMVEAGLSADPDRRLEPMQFSAGGLAWSGFRWLAKSPRRSLPSEPADQKAMAEDVAVPATLLAPLPPQRRLPRPLSPSGAGLTVDDDASETVVGSRLFPEDRSSDGASLLRGAVLHRLLQVLPGLAPGERQPAAERYLHRALPRWPESQRRGILDAVLRILDAPALSPLFSGTSRAEVSIMGTLRLGRSEHAVSGRIDRLAVEDKLVTIVDFKTNRTVPKSTADIPFVYCAQLAIYRALLTPLYPGHTIRCILIFTEGPQVMEVESHRLDAALEEIATK